MDSDYEGGHLGGAPDGAPVAATEETCGRKCLGPIVSATVAFAIIGAAFAFYYAGDAAVGGPWAQALYWVASTSALVAVPVSAHSIVTQLLNYYRPEVQKYVIRIIFIVLVFSLESWFSLIFYDAAKYLLILRSLYEAFTLAAFVFYVFGLLGGEDQLANILQSKEASFGAHMYPFKIIFPSWEMGRQFMIKCKYGVLQYVLIRIVITIIVIPLEFVGKYTKGDFAPGDAYVYFFVIMNVSIAYALYCLVKLYRALKEDLKDWNPMRKFLCIKGIIFLTFWQECILSLLHHFGVIPGVGGWDSKQVADGIQDVLISFEMVFFALAHLYVYPFTEYVPVVDAENKADRPSVNEALLDVFQGDTMSGIRRMGSDVVDERLEVHGLLK